MYSAIYVLYTICIFMKFQDYIFFFIANVNAFNTILSLSRVFPEQSESPFLFREAVLFRSRSALIRSM